MDRDHVEAEVKLAVELLETVRAFLDDPASDALAGFAPTGPSRLTESLDRYLDTAEEAGALAVRGLRARVREEDGRAILGIKDRGARDGDTHTRREIEGEATAVLDPAVWPPSVARDVLLDAIGDRPLVEIARLRQRRLKRLFRRGATEVELSLDTIDALDGDRAVATRHELEAEVVDAPQAAAGNDWLDPSATLAELAELARALRRLPGVGDHRGSKLDFARSAREPRQERVLVLCTGNSCRSQMAEALLLRAGRGRLDVESAGLAPAGVHPLTIRALDEIGIDWRGARSKSMEEFLDERFDVVVTVCDEAREVCPVFPGAPRTVHAGFPDPALADGTKEERMAAFRDVRDAIARWAEEFARDVRRE